jgi:hypothetical protein
MQVREMPSKVHMTRHIPENGSTWLIGWTLVSNPPPPRDPNDDDEEQDDEDEEGEGEDQDKEPPIVREPDIYGHALEYRGTAFIKERINIKALKLLENLSRLHATVMR